MIVVHILQWVFVGVSVPLLGLLIFSLVKAWREQPAATFAQTPPDVAAAEYRRGYTDGWSDGFDYANDERVDAASSAACCSMSADDDGEVPS